MDPYSQDIRIRANSGVIDDAVHLFFLRKRGAPGKAFRRWSLRRD